MGLDDSSLPTPVKADVTNKPAKAKLLLTAKAVMSEAKEPKTETTPLAVGGRKRSRKKQKPPAGTSNATPNLSPERMRILLDGVAVHRNKGDVAVRAGIHRYTLGYWLKQSAAGKAGYDLEWHGETWKFHEHFKAAVCEAEDKLLGALWDLGHGGVIYKTDQSLVDRGFQGPDAYLMDKDGMPVVETIRRPNVRALVMILQWKRAEKWGKHRKIKDPQEGGVVIVVGDINKRKLENASSASIDARKWKSRSRMLRNLKNKPRR